MYIEHMSDISFNIIDSFHKIKSCDLSYELEKYIRIGKIGFFTYFHFTKFYVIVDINYEYKIISIIVEVSWFPRTDAHTLWIDNNHIKTMTYEGFMDAHVDNNLLIDNLHNYVFPTVEIVNAF